MTDADFLQLFCKHLNNEQQNAVLSRASRLLLLAVPGSGKTSVLVTRLGHLILCRDIPPEAILTMTYTVAATQEMSDRFHHIFSGYTVSPQIRTINGIAHKIIMYYGELHQRQPFALEDNEGNLYALIRTIYRDYYQDYPTDSTVRDIRTAITYIKNSLQPKSEMRENTTGLRYFPDIYEKYCSSLRSCRKMDYDDQLLYAWNILKTDAAVLSYFRSQYRIICLDEAQDTSRLQHEIIRLLVGPDNELFMVGDEDQSIYGFRAACPEALLSFTDEYPGSVLMKLEINYRSTKEIIAEANHFVSRNRYRTPKTIVAANGHGPSVQEIQVLDRCAQYRYLTALARNSTESITVLFRNNDSAVPLIDLLHRCHVPFRCKKFEDVFFTHRVITDISDIILFSKNMHDNACFMRIYYKMGCMISRSAAEYACEKSASSGRGILEELIRCPDISRFTAENISHLLAGLSALPSDSATTALHRIRYELGYSVYAEQNKLDLGKFDLLSIIAQPLASPSGLLERLEELKTIINSNTNCDARIVLSTIHSAKGLEYDRVWLLDVFDGIMPMQTSDNARTADEKRAYEEERRIFYVGMTRARTKLSLFSCKQLPSEFVSEILSHTPHEFYPEEDILAVLSKKACGQIYHHKSLGTGRILAQNECSYLLEFPGAEPQFMSLSEMIDARSPQYTNSQNHTRSVGQSEVRIGSRVIHVLFGAGVIIKTAPDTIRVKFDTDSAEREFLKSSAFSGNKLKLCKE